METYNKLSHNLKQLVLDNIFKNNTNKYHKLINEQINNLYNNLNTLYNDSFVPFSLDFNPEENSTQPNTNYTIEKCDFCKNYGSIVKNKDIPYYNIELQKQSVYKSQKNYSKFFNMNFKEKNQKKYRCSWYSNFMCHSCYNGINKNISTQFYCKI